MEGGLIALCGVVGCGKTVTLRRLQQLLREENRVTVAWSLSVEKSSIKLDTLISALFYDLIQDKAVQIPKQGERRERELQELVKGESARSRFSLTKRMTLMDTRLSD